jgi:hypothetical protein
MNSIVDAVNSAVVNHNDHKNNDDYYVSKISMLKEISTKYRITNEDEPIFLVYILLISYIAYDNEKIKEYLFESLNPKPSTIHVWNRNYDMSNGIDSEEVVHHGAFVLEYDHPITNDEMDANKTIYYSFGSEILPFPAKKEALSYIIKYEECLSTAPPHKNYVHPNNLFQILKIDGYIREKKLDYHDDTVDGYYNAQSFLILYSKILDKEYVKNTLAYGKVITDIVISHIQGWTCVFLKYANKVNWKHNQNRFNLVKPGEEYTFVFTMNAMIQKIIHRIIHDADPKNKDKKFIISAGENVQFCKTESEVAFISDPRNLMANLKAFEIQKKAEDLPGAKYFKEYKLWSWQRYLYTQYLCNAPDDRSIIWVHSTKPGVGKSTMATALSVQLPQYFYSVCDPSSLYHISTIKMGALNGGWNNHCMFVNLSMRFKDYDNLYPLLENLKDPMVTQSKYQGATKVCGHGHVVVFSNFKPYPYDAKGKPLIDPSRLIILEAVTAAEEQDPNPKLDRGSIKALKEYSNTFAESKGQELTAALVAATLQHGSSIPVVVESKSDADHVLDDIARLTQGSSKGTHRSKK